MILITRAVNHTTGIAAPLYGTGSTPTLLNHRVIAPHWSYTHLHLSPTLDDSLPTAFWLSDANLGQRRPWQWDQNTPTGSHAYHDAENLQYGTPAIYSRHGTTAEAGGGPIFDGR